MTRQASESPTSTRSRRSRRPWRPWPRRPGRGARRAGPPPAGGGLGPARPGSGGADAGEGGPTRLAIAKGLILQDNTKMLRELHKQHKVRIYRVSNSAQWITEVERAEDLNAAVAKIRSIAASGTQTRLGDSVRQVLTELRG